MNELTGLAQVPYEYFGTTMGPWVIGALLALMLVAVCGVIWLTYSYTTETEGKTKKTRIRRRGIQFLAVGLGLPALMILALVDALGRDALATLFGAFFGYVLSGIGDEEKDG